MEIICTHSTQKPLCKENFQKFLNALPRHNLFKFDFFNIKGYFLDPVFINIMHQTDLNVCQHQNKLTHLTDAGAPFNTEILFSCSCFPLLVISSNILPISFSHALLNFIIVINNSMHNKCMTKFIYENLA